MKLVKESLHFKRGENPYKKIDIGVDHLLNQGYQTIDSYDDIEDENLRDDILSTVYQIDDAIEDVYRTKNVQPYREFMDKMYRWQNSTEILNIWDYGIMPIKEVIEFLETIINKKRWDIIFPKIKKIVLDLNKN